MNEWKFVENSNQLVKSTNSTSSNQFRREKLFAKWKWYVFSCYNNKAVRAIFTMHSIVEHSKKKKKGNINEVRSAFHKMSFFGMKTENFFCVWPCDSIVL